MKEFYSEALNTTQLFFVIFIICHNSLKLIAPTTIAQIDMFNRASHVNTYLRAMNRC